MNSNATKDKEINDESFQGYLSSSSHSSLINPDLNQSGILSSKELKLHENRKRNFCGIGEHYREFTFTLVATFGTVWLAWQAIIGSGLTYNAVKRLTSRYSEKYVTDLILGENACPYGYEEINYGSYWPGSEPGCFCPAGWETGFQTDMLIKGNCSNKETISPSCNLIPGTDRILLKRWRGKIICQNNKTGLSVKDYYKRIRVYLDACNSFNNPIKCSDSETKCGDRICIPKGAECPIINMGVSVNGESIDIKGEFRKGGDKLYAESEAFKTVKYCNAEDIFPISQIYIIPSKICIGGEDFAYAFPDNYELSRNVYCEEDINFLKVDSQDYQNFFSSNGNLDILTKIRFNFQELNASWHLSYSRLFGSIYFECLLRKYAIHSDSGKNSIVRELDYFINFFDQLLEKVELIKTFQEWAFFLSLITGSISVFLKITYLLIDTYPFYIKCIKLHSQKIVIFLMYFSFLFEAGITYGLAAGLGGISVWKGSNLKKETKVLVDTMCLDKSTEFYLSAYIEAVESETDNNTANLLMFLLLLVVLLLGRCTKIFKRRAHPKKSKTNIELEDKGNDEKIIPTNV